jgi:ribulose-5-phosphate 4-epimerase/fuculose-1-phosphate aldolase
MENFDLAKQQVANACHTLLERGYLKATEGNVSQRISGGKGFAITPSSYDYARMTQEDVCLLDFDLAALETGRKPSIESGMHAAVYQNRPDIHSIIHTHQPYASALALINSPIPALFDEQVRYLGRSVEIIAYGPSGTGFLTRNVQSKIKTAAMPLSCRITGSWSLAATCSAPSKTSRCSRNAPWHTCWRCLPRKKSARSPWWFARWFSHN